MKKLIYIPISAVIILFYLQALWIRNMHQNYCVQLTQSIEPSYHLKHYKRIRITNYSPYKNPNNPELIYKHAEEMSSEERKRLKGDTINLDMLAKKNISTNIAEAIMQIQQDICNKQKSNSSKWLDWIAFSKNVCMV